MDKLKNIIDTLDLEKCLIVGMTKNEKILIHCAGNADLQFRAKLATKLLLSDVAMSKSFDIAENQVAGGCCQPQAP